MEEDIEDSEVLQSLHKEVMEAVDFENLSLPAKVDSSSNVNGEAKNNLCTVDVAGNSNFYVVASKLRKTIEPIWGVLEENGLPLWSWKFIWSLKIPSRAVRGLTVDISCPRCNAGITSSNAFNNEIYVWIDKMLRSESLGPSNTPNYLLFSSVIWFPSKWGCKKVFVHDFSIPHFPDLIISSSCKDLLNTNVNGPPRNVILTLVAWVPLLEAKQGFEAIGCDCRFELGLEKPDPKRALYSALTIAVSYVLGGLVPLSPYMFFPRVTDAVVASVIVTLVALLIFGYAKGYFTGQKPVRSALQTALIGAIASAAAFGMAKAVQM
ncbi:hypothetical protein QYF36_023433 [Acer negundo]|nr:hypothetical protein QYF36_023433 [Acer negundo]